MNFFFDVKALSLTTTTTSFLLVFSASLLLPARQQSACPPKEVLKSKFGLTLSQKSSGKKKQNFNVIITHTLLFKHNLRANFGGGERKLYIGFFIFFYSLLLTFVVENPVKTLVLWCKIYQCIACFSSLLYHRQY